MDYPHKTNKFSISGQATVARLLLLLPLMSLLLRFLGFRRLYVVLGRVAAVRAHGKIPSNRELPLARRIAKMVTRTNRKISIYQAPCLSESLTLWWLLQRRGIGADFRLGVRTILGPFESHAWVEYKGVVLNDIEQVNRIYESFDLSTMISRMRSS